VSQHNFLGQISGPFPLPIILTSLKMSVIQPLKTSATLTGLTAQILRSLVPAGLASIKPDTPVKEGVARFVVWYRGFYA